MIKHRAQHLHKNKISYTTRSKSSNMTQYFGRFCALVSVLTGNNMESRLKLALFKFQTTRNSMKVDR